MCTVNVCDWLTGSQGDNARDGWYQQCCGLNGLSGESHAHLFPPKGRVRMLRDGRSCCLEGKWMLDPRTLLKSLYDRSFFFFFGVFGAATICAMCYVAWFIFHKLQSSFVVQLYKLCA